MLVLVVKPVVALLLRGQQPQVVIPKAQVLPVLGRSPVVVAPATAVEIRQVVPPRHPSNLSKVGLREFTAAVMNSYTGL